MKIKEDKVKEVKLNKLDIISSHAIPFLVLISVILIMESLFIYGIILASVTLLVIGRLLEKLAPDKITHKHSIVFLKRKND